MSITCPKCQHENPDDTIYCGKCTTPLKSLEDIDVTATIEAPKEELTTGSTFAGRYQIIEEIGKGGMGRVYKVHDTKIKEKIALKLIKPEIAKDKKTIGRFNNELRLARKIRHKNVCQMFDLGEEKGTQFITMEFVPGQDLKGLIRQTGQLAVGTTINLAMKICDGLTEAHKLGIVHRDLKPSNIMIDKEGDVRIMDFGIARSLEAKGITGAGVMIGTPEYMSPEQVEGKDVDQRSDIYSLGVILYELVTGRVPFEGDTPFTIGVKHKSEMPASPKEINPQIPDDLNNVILKCLEKDKEKRYQNAGEVCSELKNIEEGIPLAERIVPEKKPITSKEITVTFGLKKLFIPALIIIAAVVIAFLLFREPRTDYDPNRVVVAIFENLTGDEQLDPLGRMASDWISQRISQTGDIEVVPTMSIMQTYSMLHSESGAPQNAKILRTLTKDTGAGTMVTGAYYLTNNELHFQAHITDVKHQKLIHSLDPVKGGLDRRMDVIQSLSKNVMDALAVYFDKRYGDPMIMYRKPPAYEAYNEFLLGAEFFAGLDYARAIQYFTHAVELDPSFFIPKLYIAVAYYNMDRYAESEEIIQLLDKNRDQLSPFDCHILDWYAAYLGGKYEESLRFIIRAEKLAPKNPVINYIHEFNALEINRPLEAVETYAKLDSVDPEILYRMRSNQARIVYLANAHHMLGNYKQEVKAARKGQKYYPSNWRFYAYEARALAALGKIGAVQKAIDKSLEIISSERTAGSIMLEAAWELRVHGHREAYQEIAHQAVEWYKNRLHLMEVNEEMRHDLAKALYTAEKWDEAQTVFEELTEDYPENIEYQGRIGLLAARKGEREKALGISKELESIDRPYLFGEHMYMCARIASLLGEKEQAVVLLRDAFAQGLFYGAHLHNEMDFEPLCNYKPFQELLKPKG
jgi:serine/threonine protein kinase/tetratricopeptide (TPR) repeat protein